MKPLIFRSVKAILAIFLITGFAQAQELSEPESIIRPVIAELMEKVESDKELLASKQKVYELVKDRVLPLFDTVRITARSVGRIWLTATDEQKTQLVENFTDILMHTYSNAVVGREDVAGTLVITWGRASVDEKRSIVRSTIATETSKFKVDYALRNGKLGWKLDDILVNNLSIFKAYRDQFSSIIKKDGIEGLVKKLSEERDSLSKVE